MATTTTTGFGGFQRISVPCLKQIANLPPHAGKTLLAEELGIPPYTDSQDMQKAPFISYIYDSIMFAVDKGFPWEHTSLVVKVAHDFLKKILAEHHQLSDAIPDLMNETQVLAPLTERHQKQFADYIVQTVLSHYNLYKYVFTHLREVVHPQLHKLVKAPRSPPRLKEGKSVNVWEYQEKLKALADAEDTEREAKSQRCQEDPLCGQTTMANLEDVPIPYSKMALSDLVKDILKGYTVSKEKELMGTLDDTARDLEYKLKKTSLPRPLALGSPPRFKPASIVTASNNNNNNNNNNLKPEKRSAKSGRSSAASNMSRK